MRRFVAALASAAAASIFAACISLDGYTGGTPSSPEAGPADAMPSTDAAPDVEAGPDAAPSLDCAGAFLCDDFERTDLLGPWDGKSIDSSSSLVITTDISRTGHSSIRASLGTNRNAAAQLEKTLVAFSQLDYSFALYRETNATGVSMMTIIWEDGSGAFTQLYLSVDADSVSTVEQAFDATGAQTTFNEASSAPFPAKVWMPGLVHVDVVAKTYSASFNGVVMADHKAITSTFPTNIPRVQVGSGYASVPATAVIDSDDVVVRLTP